MKAELRRPASVRGWCKAKAVITITYPSSLNQGYNSYVWVESRSPETKEEADEINKVMNEIVNKLQ